MRATTTLFIISLLAIGSWCLYRDIHIERLNTGDLRNRIVGARLQKEGRLPYFYKWTLADGTRYYDSGNFDSSKVSNITATPFLHELFYPVADLPQRTISYTWLVVEYLLMLICIGIAVWLAQTRLQKATVLITAALFLLTEGWKMHIALGQVYILVPFLCMLFYCFIRKKENCWFAFFAGLCAITLILIRPTAIIFFLPFLLLIRNYNRRFLVAFAIPVALLICLILFNKQERALWGNYSDAMTEQLKKHQDPAAQIIHPKKVLPEYEGWSVQQREEDYKAFPFDQHSENGNVFVIVQHLFHYKMPVALLNILCIACMGLVVIWFMTTHKKVEYTLPSIAILGFCLYMIADLFSPFYRHQYYTTQWLFPLLVICTILKRDKLWVHILLAIGLILNIVNIDFMKMEHSIGEYLLMFATIAFVITEKNNVPA